MCKEKKTNNEIPLRPHHGMCLAYFEGKGYSEGFTAHMQRMLNLLTEGDESGVSSTVRIRLVTHTDAICAACPNNENGICQSADKVFRFDQGVLECCGFKDGQSMTFGAFVQKIQAQILSPGVRQTICQNCQWEEICAGKKSRWEET
ncbi:MAG: DUF1284 domain-containing protein [Lachnospiraceae bacterium]|nr:DUF1284 domain-containing protein [Lachnospiraceae bacterium]